MGLNWWVWFELVAESVDGFELVFLGFVSAVAELVGKVASRFCLNQLLLGFSCLNFELLGDFGFVRSDGGGHSWLFRF